MLENKLRAVNTSVRFASGRIPIGRAGQDLEKSAYESVSRHHSRFQYQAGIREATESMKPCSAKPMPSVPCRRRTVRKRGKQPCNSQCSVERIRAPHTSSRLLKGCTVRNERGEEIPVQQEEACSYILKPVEPNARSALSRGRKSQLLRSDRRACTGE